MSFMSSVTGKRTAEPQFRKREILIVLAAFAFLLAIRLPGAWAEGRFLDEEVTVFFAYAWTFDPLDALFRSFAGYWNVAANGSTLLLALAVKNDLITLEKAPYVTMLLGLTFQLAPVALLLTGQASWLPSRGARLVASALVVMVPGTEEVSLNVMHIQFHLALCVAIILCLQAPTTRSARLVYSLPLFLGPLCGPGSIVFLPLYVLRALQERDRERAFQAAVLGLAAAIQLLLFYGESPVRGAHVGPFVLVAGLLIRLIVLPLAGPIPTGLLGITAHNDWEAGGYLVYGLALLGAAIFALLGWWAFQKKDDSRWLLAAAMLIASVSIGLGIAIRPDAADYGVLVGIAGPRYNFLPVALLSLMILSFAVRGDASAAKTNAGRLVAFMLCVGAFNYSLPSNAFATGPSWPAEVASWRNDRNHQLVAWPEGPRADLSGRRFACPRTVMAPGNPDHPRYCESGWITVFYPQRN